MFRRPPRSNPALRRRQEEIEQREAELREKVQKLERMVASVSPSAEETPAAPGEKQDAKGDIGDKQLYVSVDLQDTHYFDKKRSSRRPRSLRKQRREGRIVFLLLVVALAAAIIWLMSHLHF